jgi:type IV pilus assembly protein PilC
MAKFKYTALRADGTTVTGTEEAMSVGLVHTKLLEHDLDPMEITEKRSVWEFEVTRKKVPRRELMHFSRQMSAFIRAGIPILEAIEVIAEETGNKVFRRALEDMLSKLRAGSTFADAATDHPEAFPDWYLSILRSAELTGNLDVVLDQLSTYIDRDLEARQKIVSALFYPCVIIGVAIIAVVILTGYALPKFEDFFDSLDAELPFVTRILINTSHFFSTWWYVIVGVILVVVGGFVGSLKTERGRAFKDATLLKVPGLGTLVEYAILERFCRIFSSMVAAGVPLPEAIAVTSEVTNNAVYKEKLAEARDAMIRGEGLAGPLSETGLFPAAARQIFRVGEETGTLDDQLETAAVYFDRELDYRIKRFTAMFEPAVIVFVGLIVGFVAIALVSAMYGVFDQVDI